MNYQTKPGSFKSHSGNPADRDPVRATLILKSPPAPWTLPKWYSRKITGVPFLLRNILNAQRAGIKHLTIYHKDLHGTNLEGFAGISGDPRIELELDWQSDQRKFVDMIKIGKRSLLLNGSALHYKSKIAYFLKDEWLSSASKEGFHFVSIEKLEGFLSSEKLMTSEPKSDIINEIILQDGDSKAPVYLTGDEGSLISKEDDFKIQHERLLQSSGLNNDSFMDHLITRHVSRQFTRLFLQTPLTPNQITGFSFLLGLGAAFLFYLGNYSAGVCGGALLLVSAWVDCTDGEVARLKFQETPFGSGLDIISDNLVHFAVFYAVRMGLYLSSGESIYNTLGLLAVLGSAISFFLMYSRVIKEKSLAAEGKGASKEKDLTAQIANRDFTYILFLMALADQLGIFIALTAVGANIFAAYLVYLRLKPFLMTTENLCSKKSEEG